MTNKLSLKRDHHHDHHEDLLEEEGEGSPQILTPSYVYNASILGEIIPQDFNAVKVILNATLDADLSWKREMEAARAYIERGLRILWHIECGFFDSLKMPLGNQAQFLSLQLSLEHFLEVIWKEFRKDTIGLCLYCGQADFSPCYPWDEEQEENLRDWLKDIFVDIEAFKLATNCSVKNFQEISRQNLANTSEGRNLISVFCSNVAGEFFDLLTSRMPDSLNRFVMIDCVQIADHSLRAQLSTSERFSGMTLATCTKDHGASTFIWRDASSQLCYLSCQTPEIHGIPPAAAGVCLPALHPHQPDHWKRIGEIIELLEQKGISFRLIPEVSLTNEWDGLDFLAVDSRIITHTGRRKLQGFCAAGGKILTLDPFMNTLENTRNS